MKFAKVFLAALAAVVVGSLLSGLCWILIFAGMAGSVNVPTSVPESAVLRVDLADNISDSPAQNPLSGFDFQSMTSTRHFTLLQTIRAIEAAAKDDRIKALSLDYRGGGSVSGATVEELREAIAAFKQCGKPVYAYSDGYSQIGYMLATVADKIYLHPQGGMSWVGMQATVPFYKGTLDKLGVEAEIFRPTVCKYKSAVEPYFLTKMSDANRRQMQAIVDDMWGVVKQTVSEARGIDVATLDKIANDLSLNFPDEALRAGFVDELIYRDQFEAKLEEAGVIRKKDGKIDEITLGDYCLQCKADMSNMLAPQVGIVYAEGQIVDGEGTQDGTIYGTTLAETIAKARRDEEVKAVVLRVNSPGGSALASDSVWREVELLKAEKPVIVSMGDYAASGGYYISCPADVIVADRLTLTGSIGVFGMFLCDNTLLKNKVGLSFDNVKTNSSADFGAGFLSLMLRRPTQTERSVLIRSVDQIYTTFTSNVAAGRNLDIEKVLSIAEGRVWSGQRGTEIGLVDTNGGLKEALAIAADKAGIADNFRVKEITGELSPLAAIMQSLNARIRVAFMSKEARAFEAEMARLRNALNLEGVQAYCPYSVEFE